MGPSIWQLLIIAIIVALIFGTKRLRNVGGDLGAAIRSFKKGLNDEEPNTTTPADAKTKNDLVTTSSTTSTTTSTTTDKTLEQVNDQTVSQSNSSSDQTVQKDSENPQN